MKPGLEGIPDERQLSLDLGYPPAPPKEDLEVVYDWGCEVLDDVTRALAADEGLSREWRGAMLAVHMWSLSQSNRGAL